MARLDDIVAYNYKADIFCPKCAVVELRRQITGYGPFDWTLPVEEVFDSVAMANGIDRYDEATFDSDEFPKVVFRDMTENNCGRCGKEIL